MNEYEALLGLGVTDDENMRMLAQQLRGTQASGDFLAATSLPNAQALGKAWQQRAGDQAAQIATQRTGGLNRARQAQQDAQNLRFKNLQEQRAAQTHSRNMAKPANFGTYTNTTDNTPRTGGQVYNPESGQYEWQFDSNLDQQTPYNRPYSGRSGSGGRVTGDWIMGGKDPDTDEPIYFNKRTGTPRTLTELRAMGIDPTSQTSDITDGRGQGQIRSVEERKAAIKREEQAAKAFIENQEAYKERAANFNNTLHNLNMMDQGLKNNAWTGAVADMTPTFRESTSMYESGAAGLGLAELQKHSLTPVSDRDLQLVLKSSNPNLYPENQQRWVSWMKESVTRLQKVQQAIDAANRNANLDVTRLPDSDERLQALNAQIAEIRGDHNFDFELELENEGGKGNETPQWSEEDIAHTMEKHGLTREEVLQRLGQ